MSEVCSYLGVSRGDPLVRPLVLIIRVSAVGSDHIHSARDDERKQLLARPHWLGLDDGRLWDNTIPSGQVHQEVHKVSLKMKVHHKFIKST